MTAKPARTPRRRGADRRAYAIWALVERFMASNKTDAAPAEALASQTRRDAEQAVETIKQHGKEAADGAKQKAEALADKLDTHQLHTKNCSKVL